MGVEPITPTLQGSVAPNGMPAHSLQRSVRELNPVFVLTTDVCRPKHLQTEVIAAGIEPAWTYVRRIFIPLRLSPPLGQGALAVTFVVWTIPSP